MVSHTLPEFLARPIKSQFKEATQRLVKAFVAAIPYQGFVVVDDLVGKAVNQVDEKFFVKVGVGLNAKIEVGDRVQLVRIKSDKLRTLFDENLQIEIFADGEVSEAVVRGK